MLFAAAFPPAPLMALFVMQLEIRSDAERLLTTKRLPPQTVEGIGNWFRVMEVVTTIAVATNCGIVCFTSDSWLGGQPVGVRFGTTQHTGIVYKKNIVLQEFSSSPSMSSYFAG